MNRSCVQFYPGQYHDFEKPLLDKIEAIKNGTAQPEGMLMPPGANPPLGVFMDPAPITEEEILEYNRKWNPYDPLYTDPDYARAHGHPSIPAYPGFGTIKGGKEPTPAPSVNFRGMFDSFVYTADGDSFEYYRNIYPGDMIVGDGGEKTFADVTPAGSTTRIWQNHTLQYGADQSGSRILRYEANTREGYMKFNDGGPGLTITESLDRWVENLPPAHYTTDEEWDYIRQLWSEEVIQGDNTPYWEDVCVGQELPKTCSDGPITSMTIIGLQGMGPGIATYNRDALRSKEFLKTVYRDRLGNYFNDAYQHYCTRNIPGARSLWYNDTAARLVARTLTNFVGTKGRVSKFSWVLHPFAEELAVTDLCRSMFNKVPGMNGKFVNRHGSDGDLCIGRAVITDKYINAQGEHCCEIALWAEDLEGNVVQGCPSEIVLPSKNTK